jgi:predicted transcriptional regulator
MADLTITATSVVPGSGATIASGIAGETILAGQSVYIKTADGKLWKAKSSGTVEEATCAGIAVNGGSVGQTVSYVTDGIMTIGATTAKTTTYMVSATAGGVAPQADLISTNKISIVGYATDAAGAFVVLRRVTGAVV